MRSHLPRWQKQNLEANLALVRRIQEIARLHNVTPGQVALAWVLAQGEDVVPIPGTKRTAYLEENINALRVRLPKTALDELTQMRATGGRYPEHSVTGGETLA
jgi:aryl-alcohol dehydrogenase-like predicted oxidoreductase